MVQVVHRYHNSYPFGLDKLSQNTFLMIVKENLNEPQISLYRQKCKILKTLSNNHFIKLQKMLKEENTLHLQFQYFPLSLEKYIEAVKNEGHSSRQRCKALISDFNASIDTVIEQLVKYEVKTDVFLSNIAVIAKQKGGMQLKVFIEPECEILSLAELDSKGKEGKKKNYHEQLRQFYEAERKRLNIEFQELLEQYFGKIQQIEKKQMPNFVINGTKLTFISPEKEENVAKQSKIEQPKTQNTKEKMEKKLEEHKKINQQVQQKLQNMTPPLKNKQQQGPVQAVVDSKKPKVEKIVNFDQSFEPEFKPEQFTNQNTYILEQNDYLESLEQQLVKLASDKKLTKQHPSKATHSHEKIKEETTTTSEDKKIANDSQKSIESQKQANKSNSQNNSNTNINQQNSSNSKNSLPQQNQNNSNTSNNSNQVQCLQICKVEPKDTAIIQQKIFKYKMKIITSHQIEIQGDGEPNVEEIQREIMEGIKTGKLNINDLASQKKSSQGSQNKSGQINTSNQNSKDSKQMSGSTHTQKSANPGNFLKEAKEKIVQSSHEGTKKEFYQPPSNPQILQTRSSDLQQPKMRSINEIIERIGINKANQNHANQVRQAKLAAFKESGSHHNEQGKMPNIHTNTTPHYKSEKIEMAEQKVEKADNYLTKIRQAKEKAQLILKQYTKKKQ